MNSKSYTEQIAVLLRRLGLPRCLFIICCSVGTINLSAQALYNNGATLFVNSGATLRVNGNLTNATGGSISNRGAVTLTGNLVNNNSIGGTSTGAWAFAGTGVQTVSGSGPQFVPRNLTINNAPASSSTR